jgi:hypothetical protein
MQVHIDIAQRPTTRRYQRKLTVVVRPAHYRPGGRVLWRSAPLWLHMDGWSRRTWGQLQSAYSAARIWATLHDHDVTWSPTTDQPDGGRSDRV